MVVPRSCPCGLPDAYAACCGRFHHGEPAPTAELLMRSRYTAFALGDVAYLRRTWDPATRPRRLVLDAAVRWTGLDVLATTGGGPDDDEGTVRFHASHRGGVLAEHSLFRRTHGQWLYVEALDESQERRSRMPRT